MIVTENISRNFHALKFFSILMVFFGHFFADSIPLAWVPVTVGLLIFSFSSGLFTSLKYTGSFSKAQFWKSKAKRLGVNLLVINLALLVLFLFQQRAGILSWQTLVNVVGLNGFLNWFYIDNISPYGNGMWFFTLLLIFYFLYPLLDKAGRKGIVIVMVLSFFIAYFMNMYFSYGHALWLTSCGFVAGVCAGKTSFSIPSKMAIIIALSCFATMAAVNIIFQFNALNFWLILVFSICFIYAFYDVAFPKKYFRIILFFSMCLLEIYLFHTYFFVHPTGFQPIDFVLSVILVLALSKAASSLSSSVLKAIEST